MAPLAVPIMLAGTAMSAYGQYQEGKAASAEAKYQAQVQERQAKATEQKTAFEQRRLAEEQSRRKGTLQSQLGASGAVTTAGSPLMIMAEQAGEDDLDQALLGYEGREESTMLRHGAAVSRMKAKNAKTAGMIGAGSTLLHGFGSAYNAR